jgi:hypothetical protein
MGASLKLIQINSRRKQGKAVLPIMMRKAPNRRKYSLLWKETIELGVNVKPTSWNDEAAVNNALYNLAVITSRET